MAIKSYACVLGITICGHEMEVIVGPQIQHHDLDPGFSGEGKERIARQTASKHK